MLNKNDDTILKIRDLTLGYVGEKGTVITVDNVSLDIPKGKISSIVGESGSGKSTLANAIIGFIKYPLVKIGGSIEYNGENLLEFSRSKLNKIRMRSISFVPQAAMNSLNPVMRIGDEIHDIIQSHGKKSPSEEKDMIKRALGLVDLPEHILNSYQNQISGGMKQRVMIAIAILLDPDIIILDEPTTGLDVIVQKNILDSIRKINSISGTTILLITHDLPVAFYVSDYTSIIYSGKIVEEGAKDSVIKNKLHPYTELLMGSIPSISDSKKRLVTIRGSVTTVFQNQTKCTFSNRCPYALEICKEVEIKDYEVNGETVKCIRYDDTFKGRFPKKSPEMEPETIPSRTGVIGKIYSNESHRIELQDAVMKFNMGRGSNKKTLTAVDHSSIKIESGKISALVGASGSGKTTVGKIFLFDETLSEGKYIFDGKELTRISRRQKKGYKKLVQMVFQDPFSSLSPIHKIGHQIERPLLINKISTKETSHNDVLSMLNLVGLRPPENFVEKFPYELSGGQRQRVCIAKALSVGAKLLVADEPVSMLDASVRAEILNLLVDLRRELNLGVLYITHDLSTVNYVAEDVYVMNKGKIVEYGEVSSLFSSPKEEYTKILLDSIV